MRTFILTSTTLTVALTMGAAHGTQDFFLVLTPLVLYWLYGEESPRPEGPFNAE